MSHGEIIKGVYHSGLLAIRAYCLGTGA